jgi:hypothetical protein
MFKSTGIGIIGGKQKCDKCAKTAAELYEMVDDTGFNIKVCIHCLSCMELEEEEVI